MSEYYSLHLSSSTAYIFFDNTFFFRSMVSEKGKAHGKLARNLNKNLLIGDQTLIMRWQSWRKCVCWPF